METSPQNKWKQLQWLTPTGNYPSGLEACGRSPASDAGSPAVTFKYAPSPAKLVAAAVFFGLGGMVLWMEAATNDRGLILEGLIELSPISASRFFYAISLLSYGMVAFAVFLGIPQLFTRRQIVLHPSSITLPGCARNISAAGISVSCLLT